MDSKYLPSKSFIKKAGILLGLIIIVLIITKITPSIRAKISSDKMAKILVKDALYNDKNSNGIQDWEEKLWGLDPAGDGASNKEFINAKKKLLGGDSNTTEVLSSNEKMSREFFSLIMSLEDSGLTTDEALAKISEQIGQKIELIPVEDTYKFGNISTVPPTKDARSKFKSNLTIILEKYKKRGVGSEMNLVAMALDYDDKSLLAGLTNIKSSYLQMISEILILKVPNEIAQSDLTFLNNLQGSAMALDKVQALFDDSIGGLTGIATYKKDNDDAAQALVDISNYLENGIIN